MKRRDARLRINIFYILLLAPTVIWLILSAAGAAEKLDTATGEKRDKHEVAEGTTLGNLTEELELTYNDNVPFRSVLLKMNSRLNTVLEVPYQGAILPGLTALANASMDESEYAGAWEKENVSEEAAVTITPEPVVTTEPSAEEAGTPAEVTPEPAAASSGEAFAGLTPYYETPTETGYYPYVELAPEVIQGRDGWLFRDESIPDYQGDTIVSDETLASETADMQALDAICDAQGTELYYIAIPNKNTVYPEYMPSIDKADYTGLMQLEDYVHANTDLNFIFMNDELLAAKNYGRLYLVTDTHWNGRGALACNVVLHQMMGLDPIDMGSLPEKEGEPYVGDLIYYTGLPVDSFPTDLTADYDYKPEITVNQIRGGDDILDEFTSNAPDGRTFVYVGDSYRHNIMPYLNKDFAHTYFINCKALGPEYADILNSADILVVENVERNYYINPDAGNAVSDLISIMG